LTKDKHITIESAMQRIEQILAVLEENTVNVDEIMKLYEESMLLLNYCRHELEKAEEKVKIISLNGEKIEIKDFMD